MNVDTWADWVTIGVRLRELRLDELRTEPDLSRLTATDTLRLSRDRDVEPMALRTREA